MANNRVTTNEFISRARKQHGDKYDYSKTQYNSCDTNVCIICPLHGEFYQTPSNHTYGRGCKECGRLRLVELNANNITDFIRRATIKHGDTYDYTNVIYTNARCKVSIICRKHGEYIQYAHHHMNGNGCPKCCSTSISKWERTVQSRTKEKYPDASFNDRHIDRSIEIDIYIPSINVAIECQGDYWHMNPSKYSEISINKTMHMSAKQIWDRDANKHELIRNLGINLVLIWEYDWRIATRMDKISGSSTCVDYLLENKIGMWSAKLSPTEWNNIIEQYNADKAINGVKRIMYNNGVAQIRIAEGSEIPSGFIRGCLPESDEHKRRRKYIRDMKKTKNTMM